MLPVHRKYLSNQRRLDPDEIAQLWGVQGIGLAAEYAWRLWIPVYHFGEVVSWTTRAIGTGMRYLHAPPEQESVPIKSVLYGSDLVRHAVIICEGPIDAWTIGPGAVATCGLGYTREQLIKLSQFSVKVVCFDSEFQAQKRARRLARQLQVFPGETYVVELQTGKDPNEADRREIMELRKTYLE
jgi:DNA primase